MADKKGKNATGLVGANDDLAARIDILETKLAYLSQVTEALWFVLRDCENLSEADLAKKMEEVMQHRKDRREAKQKCSSCGMMLAVSLTKCIYCGGEIEDTENKSVFDKHFV